MNFSFWKKFGRGARSIKDLSADEIAGETIKQFKHGGWGSLTGRLLYRGLELDPRHVPLLIGLSEYFSGEPNEKIPAGAGLLSGLILDYGLSLKGSVSPEAMRLLEVARLKLMWKWGLAHNVADRKNRAISNFEDSSAFDTDEVNFVKAILTARSGKTIMEGFWMAHVRAGVRSGALIAKKESVENASDDPRDYRHSPSYKNWLLQDGASLMRMPG